MRRRIDAALFVGPSLRRSDLAHLPPQVEILPPAAQGDIYRLSQFAPKVIGLVDGFFHSVPAPWHKEILWALSQGMIVYGAASMGALRAAELAPFGMRGIGRIFEQFDEGALEDDDEVAVIHGPAELGYPLLSDAMVNVRATLSHAVAEGTLEPERHEPLIALAKSRPFWERSFATLFADAAGAGQPLPKATQDWVVENAVDCKREDAQHLVDALIKALDEAPPLEATPRLFRFEHTTMWETVRRNHKALEDTPVVGLRELVEEVALKGQYFVRSLGLFPLSALGIGDHKASQTASWNLLDQDHDVWMQRLVDTLKRSGTYDELIDFAKRKKQIAQAQGAFRPIENSESAIALHFDTIGEKAPWFTNRTSTSWYDDGVFWKKFDHYAQSLGLRNSTEFVQAVIRDQQLRERVEVEL